MRTPFAVEYHDERKNGYALNTPDDEWLADVSKKRWIVVSHDKRFHADSLAIAAVKQHGGRVFYLDGGSSVKWDKLRRFATSYKRMVSLVDAESSPFIYRVNYADRVTLVRRF